MMLKFIHKGNKPVIVVSPDGKESSKCEALESGIHCMASRIQRFECKWTPVSFESGIQDMGSGIDYSGSGIRVRDHPDVVPAEALWLTRV